MMRLLYLFTALVAIILVLAACGSQPATEAPEPPEPTEALAADATEPAFSGSGADATSAPAAEVSKEADESSASDSPISLVDPSGETLTFDEPPERIVCVHFSCLVELSFFDVVPVAVADVFEDRVIATFFGEEASEGIVRIPMESNTEVDFELIASLEPNLVIGYKELSVPLEGVVPVIGVFGYEESRDGLLARTEHYATLFGNPPNLEEQLQVISDRIEAYTLLVPDNRTVLLTYPESADNLNSWRVDGRYGRCGWFEEFADCLLDEDVNGNTTVEGLLDLDPDVILIQGYNYVPNDLLEQMSSDPLWQELTAYQNDEIYVLELEETSGTTSLTVLDTVYDAWMIRIYPDIFPDGPLTDEEVQEILTEL